MSCDIMVSVLSHSANINTTFRQQIKNYNYFDTMSKSWWSKGNIKSVSIIIGNECTDVMLFRWWCAFELGTINQSFKFPCGFDYRRTRAPIVVGKMFVMRIA